LKFRCWFLIASLLLAFPALGDDTVVVFNEIMYHPRDPDAVEWIELYNQMAVDVDLSGWSIKGADFFFPTNTIIAGGKYLLIASDPAELARRTGLGNIAGPLGGKLANSGEKLQLLNLNERVMDVVDFRTDSPWPAGPDGSGFTLAKNSPLLASSAAENWSTSAQPGGTPGLPNFSASLASPGILLNEIAPGTHAVFWLELVNRGSAVADLSGAEIEFGRGQFVAKIPESTLVNPGAYYVYYPTGYVGQTGEKIFLYSAGRTKLWDSTEVKARLVGRSPENENAWLFPSAETPGAANIFNFTRDVVINEVMYGHAANQTNASWIELLNRGTNTIDLSNWKLSPVDYQFPKSTILGPGELMVVAHDAAALRARFPVARVLGNFGKGLSGSSDHIVLQDQFGNPANELRYFDAEPWPAFANDGAVSLELRDPHADNSEPEAWAASVAPGQWQSYSYTASAAADGGPTRWNEFVFGLLEAGEVLLDDFSVTENPSGTGREILQNGQFENGATSWRFLGTHRNASVITDPDNPTNHVLHLVADGTTEHMHNHVETTLLNNQPIKNGTAYRISWRAKWLAGNNLLNTRLYFNRAARTTALQRLEYVATPGAPNSVAESNIGPTFSALSHFPVVPKSADSVQISIHAEDPDGVKRCRLWSAANGSNWSAVDMTASGDHYSASLPPRAAATVVQFYIEAEDNRGAISFYPAAGVASCALYKVNDNQALSSRIHNFRLIMLPSEATALHASTNVMSNGRSLCTVIYDESEVFYNCGLHLQASERGRLDATRVGFTVNFPADHLFRGVQNTVTFDRSGGWSGIGGRQDEIVIRHIINQAGDSPDMYNDLVRVLTPLTTHTGTAMLLMSKYSNEFIDGSIYPKNGALSKLELIYYPTTSMNNNPLLPKIPQPDDVVGVEIGNLGSSHENYRWNFLAENRAGADDYDGIIRVAQAFSLSGTALQQKTDQLLDIEQWIRVFAFKSLSGDADTYGFGYPHNQLIYVPPSGKALTFPWDMDFSWSLAANGTINVGARIGQIIHPFPARQRLFLGNIRDILDTSYNTNYMARWTAHYASLAGQNYSGVLNYINQRAKSARTQLPALSPLAITTFSGNTFVTNAASMTLRGTAPYTIKRLQLNTNSPAAGFTWTTVQSWETTVPLSYGSNRVTLVGYDFHNRPFITNEVTILSSAGLPDRDHDGMPDDWEVQMGLNPDVADADLDPDHDGMTNLAEYLAGTSPLDPNSSLRLSASHVSQEQFDLSFVARGQRSYRVQYRVGLSSNWTDLLTIPAGPERTITQTQTVSSVAPALFYRVLLQSGLP
jgi:hypothetical protein